NWRYRDDPLNDYVVWVARRAGKLVAWACFLITGRDALLVDLFGHVTEDVARVLIAKASELVPGRDVEVLHAVSSDQGHLARLLGAAGFHPRSATASVVAYAPATSPAMPSITHASWDFTAADVQA